MVQPTQLLEDLGVVRVALEDPAVGALGRFEFFLLLIDVTNLEPDILFGQGPRWVSDNVLEALTWR